MLEALANTELQCEVMISTLPTSDAFIAVEEYLATEPFSEVKREYLGGIVYAMAGASEAHNIIAMNLYVALGTRLRGKPCQPFGSDMKLKLRSSGDTYLYYPDAMIACDPTDSGHGWRERPAVLFEIISDDTRHTDEREKRFAYRQLASLQAYVRIEQTRPEAVLESRAEDGWKAERLIGLDAVLKLPAVQIDLPLSELYERLSFPAS
jgi:Uma2 family endonuclease